MPFNPYKVLRSMYYGKKHNTKYIIYNTSGFSLVEILVTISLVALVAAVSMPNLQKYNSDLGLEYTVSDVNQVLKVAQSHAHSSIICDNGGVALSWNVEFKPTSYSFHGNCSGNYKDIRINSRAFTSDNSTQMVSNNCSDAQFTVEFSKTDVNATCINGNKVSNTLAVTLKNNKDTNLLADINISKGGLIFPGFRKPDPSATPFPTLNPTPTAIPTASPTPSYQAILLENKTNFTGQGNGSNKIFSWSHTVGTGTNRGLIVGVSYKDAGNSISSITYGSQSMSKIVSSANGTSVRVDLWKLENPASGANTITLTFTNSVGNKMGIIAESSSFTGVNQSDPIGIFNTASGNTINPSLTLNSADNQVVVDVYGAVNNLPSAAGGQILIYSTSSGVSTGTAIGAGSYKSGSLSTTLTWVVSNPGNWILMAVPLKPAQALSTPAPTSSPCPTSSGGGPPPVCPFL